MFKTGSYDTIFNSYMDVCEVRKTYPKYKGEIWQQYCDFQMEEMFFAINQGKLGEFLDNYTELPGFKQSLCAKLILGSIARACRSSEGVVAWFNGLLKQDVTSDDVVMLKENFFEYLKFGDISFLSQENFEELVNFTSKEFTSSIGEEATATLKNLEALFADYRETKVKEGSLVKDEVETQERSRSFRC